MTKELGKSYWKMISRSSLAIVIAVAFVLMTFASTPFCGSAQGEHEYWVGTTIEIDSFNPFTMTSITSYAICGFMFDYLYIYDIDGNPYPQLAESYTMSEDGLVWTFAIKQNAYWHDNEQVTASDVNFTFNMVLRNPAKCSLLANYLDGVVSVEQLNEFTVQLTLDEPKRGMLEIWIPILPEHYWTAIEEDNWIDKVEMLDTNYFPNGAVGSGPFILSEFSGTLGYITLLRWDLYHFGPVNVEALSFKIFDNEAAMGTALEVGDIDAAVEVPVTRWDSLIEEDHIEGIAVPSIRFKDFGFNCATPEIREATDDGGKDLFPKASENYETLNLAVRQACAMVVNKTLIVDEIYQGFAVEGSTLVSTSTPFWHYEVPEEDVIPFDLDLANETLENAGYKYISSTTIRENETSGVLLDFQLYYANPYLADQMIAEHVSENLAKVGINAPPNGVPEGVLMTMWFGMEYDMFIWDWWPTVDPSWILAVLTTDEIPDNSHDIMAWSDTYYSNPYYDDLYEQQNAELDRDARQGIVFEMQAIAYRDCPYSILCYLSTMTAYRTDDWVYPINMVDYSVRDLWLYFEILPAGGEINLPPENVNAGPDQTADVGETLFFTGSADDPNSGDVLTWNWTFQEPDSSIEYREGQTVSYAFLNEGIVNVTLKVTDSGGLSASDEAIVTVSEAAIDAGWIRGYVNDTAGDPIVGATVEAGNKTKTTDDQGMFNVSLSPGMYDVNVSADGYANVSDQATVETELVTWLNFTLSATAGALLGVVYDEDTGATIGGARVTLEGEVTYEKVANSEGEFQFPSVAEGTYNMTVQAAGYFTNSTTVTIVAGETSTLDVYLEEEIGSTDDSSSSIALWAAALALIVAIVAALAILAKRKKKGPAMEELPGSEDTEPPQPPSDEA